MPSDESDNSHDGSRAKRGPQVRAFLSALKPLARPTGGFALLLLPLAIPLHETAWLSETTTVKLVGLILQLIGIALVCLGLSQARETFGERGLWRWLRSLVNHFVRIILPPWRRSASLEGSVAALKVTASGNVHTTKMANTLEERVTALEEDLKQSRQDLDQLRKELSTARTNLTKKIDVESRTRHAEDRKIRDMMAEAVIGGIHLEATGVVYIAVGIVLTTFPGPVASVIYWTS